MPWTSHHPWLHYSNYTQWRVQVTKLIMQFSQPPTTHSSLVQIFSSAPCSWTLTVCIPTLMSETKFYTHTE
jgi:hypothetical protein